MPRKRPPIALHKGSTKDELDAFLEQWGATVDNPYSVEEIFGAVTSAMWDAVVVPKLAFAVDEQAVSKVRLALDRARLAGKRQCLAGPEEPKEKHPYHRLSQSNYGFTYNS